MKTRIRTSKKDRVSADSCGLCGMKTVKAGAEKLLYEDESCYIVDNPKRYLYINGRLMHTHRRIAFILKRHVCSVRGKERARCMKMFRDFLLRTFGARENTSYLLLRTMTTYPHHFHVHAFFLPLVPG